MSRLTIQPYFFLFLPLGTVAIIYYMFRPFLAVLALAAILAVVLKPAYLWFKNRLGFGATGGALVFSLIMLVILVAISSLLLGRVFMETRGLYESLIGQQSVSRRNSLLTSGSTWGSWLTGWLVIWRSSFPARWGWCSSSFF
jgi:predicted PurR-regulated permease PerM